MRKVILLLFGIIIGLAAVMVLPEKEHGEGFKEELPKQEKESDVVAQGPVEPEQTTPPEQRIPFEITLIHSNDTHTVHDNIAKTATLIKDIRNANDYSLLLSAGDVTSWEIGNKAQDALENAFFMNHLGYEGTVLGNHEFDLGEGIENHEALGNYIKNTSFPVLAGNMDFSKDEFLEPLADYNYTSEPVDGRINKGYIVSVDGEKIGIFGITHYKEVVTVPGDVSFLDYTETAKEAVAHFEQQGINKIIALSHIGIGNDRRLAEAVPEIDVIIGGHSHVTTSPPNKIGDTLVVQAGVYNEFLGELNLIFDDEGKITEHNGKLHKVTESEEHPKTKELMTIFNQAMDLDISSYEELMQYAKETGAMATGFELAQ